MKKIILSIICVLLFSTTVFGAWSFDETDDNVQITDDAVLTFPDADWTISLRVKLDDNAGSQTQALVSWGGDGASPSFNWYFREEGKTTPNAVTFRLLDSEGDGETLTHSTSTPATRRDWIHMLLQRTAGGVVTQYIDNAADGTFTDAAFDEVNVAGNLFFGTRSDLEATRFLGGDMCEIAFWNRALLTEERQGLTDGFSPLFYLNGLTWYISAR